MSLLNGPAKWLVHYQWRRVGDPSWTPASEFLDIHPLYFLRDWEKCAAEEKRYPGWREQEIVLVSWQKLSKYEGFMVWKNDALREYGK